MTQTIAVLDPYYKDAVALLKSTPDINIIWPDDSQRATWHGQADGVVIRSTSRLTEDDFAKAAPRLKVVVKQGVGVDNIDLEGAKKHGIAVHNTPALNAEAVAELSLALTLSLSRRVAEFDRRARAGEAINRTQNLGISIFGKTVGIVGMGNIGYQAAKKWTGACNATLIGYDPAAPSNAWGDISHTRAQALEELVRAADIITLHVPLLPTTRGMIGERELGLMKKNAILVNTARGGLVDEAALLKELKAGKIWGAVLDAMETEPPTIKAYPELLKLDNIIVTPHVGGSTEENQSLSGCTAVKNCLAVMRGEKDVVGKLV